MSCVDLSNLFLRTVELKDGRELCLSQSGLGDVGCVVWDAALVLCKYLETPDLDGGRSLQGKSVLELGAGTGAVGLLAAALGSKTTVTDLPQFVPLMQHNIAANQAVLTGSCVSQALTWGNVSHIEAVRGQHVSGGVDYILLADCVYYEESLEPLVETIQSLSTDHTTILISYEDRELGDKTALQIKFFSTLAEYFDISDIPQSSQDPHFSSPDIHIKRLRKRS